MPQRKAISVHIATDKLAKLEELAELTGCSRAWHLDQALDAYLEVQAWQLEHIEKGIASIKEGRVVPHERVQEWLESWGKDGELEAP